MFCCTAVRMGHRVTNWRHNGAPQECNLIHRDESEIVMHKGRRGVRRRRARWGEGGGRRARLMRLLCLNSAASVYSLPGQPSCGFLIGWRGTWRRNEMQSELMWR